MDAHVREQLERQIATIARDCPAPRPVSEAPRDTNGFVDSETHLHDTQAPNEAFAGWLLAQRDRGDWIDELANAARADRGFPKNADPEQVRAYLGKRGITDADVFEQVDDAERCWSSL